MMVVCKDRLDSAHARERLGIEAAASVEADIANLLSGKSYDHLVALQRQIQTKLASREPLDVEYWEGLLKKLLVYKSQVIGSLHRTVTLLNPRFLVKAKNSARDCCPE